MKLKEMLSRPVSKILHFTLYLSLVVHLATSQSLEKGPVFKDGDKICFIGNSITNNAQFYHFINLYYATRYPERKVVFINCGISGDVTQGIINRMETDILVHNPTWSVLMIGMNDVNRNLYAKSRANEPGIEEKKQQALEVYRKNLEIIVPKLLENGRKLILQTPSIYDQTADLPTENFFGVNDALKKCAGYAQELAEKYKLPTVDYWTILTEVNKQIQQKDPKATIIGPDRVHPAAPGHLIMAYQFLKSTGGSRYVSKIQVRANVKESNQYSANCLIKELVFGKDSVRFTVKEESLPFPAAGEDIAPALALVPFTDDLNQEILQVERLSKGNYRLFIDDNEIGIYASQDLKKGVNLASKTNTPQYQQAVKIMNLYAEHRKVQAMYRNIVTIQIHHLPDSLKDASRETQVAFLNTRLEEKFKTSPQYNYYQGQFKSYLANKPRQKEITKTLPEIVDTIYNANKPVFHSFRLVKVSEKRQ
ncbi:SGNH/GDSL hydrolase family protein [Dyadobacter sp. CY323]|uniref:SGNH/GDSL hydrolase family protein n=1 Tax=Dyadobacter sp. CY323 TaxID=2907302 RepID=UPI001F2E23B4|nr:SGNH/GDSL hydrolase family protein [Dyadobacter sp. CY323]MCE6991273.1 SGNH/GDSL hydrolase family protein [Dyadobacter sp. CY323]